MIFKRITNFVIGTALLIASLLLPACVPGTSLRTSSAGSSDLQGTYTLILFGGNYGDDLETVAILDKEDDRFIIEPYAPEFRFRLKRGLSAERALKEADDFIQAHPSFSRGQLRSIRNESGAIVGYELRPLYLPFVFGVDDILDIDYWMQGDRVIAKIRVKPFLENQGMDFRHDHQ